MVVAGAGGLPTKILTQCEWLPAMRIRARMSFQIAVTYCYRWSYDSRAGRDPPCRTVYTIRWPMSEIGLGPIVV